MQKYELVLIFKPDLKEKEQKKIVEGIEKVIGGKKIKVDFWGKRRLSYEIKKQKEGVYYLLSFEADPRVLPKLEKVLKSKESIIRYLIVRTS